MEALFNSLAQSSGVVLAILLGVVVLMGAWVASLQSRLNRQSKRWRDLLTAGDGRSLESLLEEHLDERQSTRQRFKEVSAELEDLEKRMQTSKRFLGMVRYDAFPDVGGEQSFALAIFDEDGNGTVITSLVGRTDCRVYAKPLVQGRSERTLSQEEQRAIREAAQAGPRSMVGSGA